MFVLTKHLGHLTQEPSLLRPPLWLSQEVGLARPLSAGHPRPSSPGSRKDGCRPSVFLGAITDPALVTPPSREGGNRSPAFSGTREGPQVTSLHVLSSPTSVAETLAEALGEWEDSRLFMDDQQPLYVEKTPVASQPGRSGNDAAEPPRRSLQPSPAPQRKAMLGYIQPRWLRNGL